MLPSLPFSQQQGDSKCTRKRTSQLILALRLKLGNLSFLPVPGAEEMNLCSVESTEQAHLISAPVRGRFQSLRRGL